MTDQDWRKQATKEQRDKVKYHIKQWGVHWSDCNILIGCLGLPSDWVSLAIPKGEGRWFVCGIDPEGNTSS